MIQTAEVMAQSSRLSAPKTLTPTAQCPTIRLEGKALSFQVTIASLWSFQNILSFDNLLGLTGLIESYSALGYALSQTKVTN